MSTETQVSPVAETQNQAAEVVETPEVTTPEVEVTASEPSETPAPDKPESEADKALKRMQRRIDKRTADVYRERAEKEQYAKRAAELEAQLGTETRPPEQVDPKVLAREIARVERFREQAEQIVNAGSKAHGDYMASLKDLAQEVGDFVKPNGAPSDFMEVVLEVVDKPADVLYYLGKNPDVAGELADLSPLRLAKRLDRIERELTEKAAPKPGTAPKPIEPVKPRASVSTLPSDNDSLDDWMAKERKRMAAQGLTRYG